MQNVEDIYPLTAMQELMLLRLLAGGEDKALKEIARYTLRGELDVPLYQRAWQAVIDRHPILRTAFLADGLKKPVQVVRREAEPEWAIEDWQHLGPDDQSRRLQAFLDEDQRRGFDPAQAPLMRFAVIRMADDRYEFVQSLHHMLMDRWSGTQVMNEVMQLYEGWRSGEEVTLPPVHPFRAYVHWLETQDRAEAESHWTRALAGFQRPTQLPFDRPDDGEPPLAPGDTELRRVEFDAASTAALQSWSREQRITLNTVVSGAWGLVLSHAGGADDVVFGVTVSGRPPDLEAVEEIVGLFINNLPVRVRVDGDADVAAWLRDLQSEHARSRRFEHTPSAMVQEWSEVPAGQPLFDSLYVFQNPVVADGQGTATARPSIEIVDVWGEMRTGYPLTLVAYPQKNLTLQLSYDAAQFRAETIDALLGDLRAVLEGLTAAGATPNTLRAPLRTIRRSRPIDGETPRTPEPVPSAAGSARAYVAPSTESERMIAKIWCDLLGVDRIGARDKFFDVGGSSVLAIQCITRLEKEHGVRLSPAALMFQTLAQLGALYDSQSDQPGGARAAGTSLLRRILPRRRGRRST